MLRFRLCAICMAWASAEAGAVGQPLVLTISVESLESQTGPESNTIEAGSDAFIKAHLTNTSKHNLSLGVRERFQD